MAKKKVIEALCEDDDVSPLLQSIVIESLHKDMKDRRESTSLPQGEHEFHGQLVFQVDTTVEQRAGGLAKPTVSLPLKAILAIALKKLGIQREGMKQFITDVAFEARAMDETVTETMEEEVGEIFKEAVDKMIDKLPKIPRAGNVMVASKVKLLKVIHTKQVSEVIR